VSKIKIPIKATSGVFNQEHPLETKESKNIYINKIQSCFQGLDLSVESKITLYWMARRISLDRCEKVPMPSGGKEIVMYWTRFIETLEILTGGLRK
jgi:hypothetical protein